MLLSICGYPEPESKEYDALIKMNITNTYKTPELASLLRNMNDSTKSIITSLLNNNS